MAAKIKTGEGAILNNNNSQAAREPGSSVTAHAELMPFAEPSILFPARTFATLRSSAR